MLFAAGVDAKVSAANNSATSSPITILKAPDAAKVDRDLAERLAASDRRNLILEARSDIEDKAFDRFSLLMAAIGGLITLLVVGFGVFTHRAAVTAARQEMADLKDKINLLHQDAATAKEQAFEAAETARRAAEGAQAHQQQAEEASEIVRQAAILAERVQPQGLGGPGHILSAAERQTVSEAAKEVSDKPERQWSADEFRIKITEAYSDSNWAEMLRLSRGMEFLYAHDPESLAFALLRRGWALTRLDKSEEAVAAYDELVDRFIDSDITSIRTSVANALFNKGVRLGVLGEAGQAMEAYEKVRQCFGSTQDQDLLIFVAKAMVNKAVKLADDQKFQEEIDIYEEVIELFAHIDKLNFMEQVAFALENKGISLIALGRDDDAVLSFDDLITRYESNDHPTLQDLVRSVTLKKAQVRGRQGRVRPCVEALESWRRLSGGSLDCEVIGTDDFRNVRDKPTFRNFLRAHGCAS